MAVETLKPASTKLIRSDAFDWGYLALTSTRLQTAAYAEEHPWSGVSFMKSDELVVIDYTIYDRFMNSDTALASIQKPVRVSSTNLATYAAEIDEDVFPVEDITVRPVYVNQFRLKVGKLKITQSMPKIFAD